jgi:hypothetical protein
LENKFHDIKMNIFTIMPNHFHAIVENVGADLCVCPAQGAHTGAPLRLCNGSKNLGEVAEISQEGSERYRALG